MNLLKSLPIIVALFSSIQISAQKEDTTCIKSRWIALSPSTQNATLFTDNSTNSILSVIKKGVLERKVFLYDSEESYATRQFSDVGTHNTNANNKLNRFELEIESTTPLANMYGEDSVVTLDDGTMLFVYPPKRKYEFNFSDISEIRIKEARIYNKETNSFTFQPVRMSFCAKTNGKEHELFIVDIDELMSVVNGKETYNWVDVLSKKKYSGFQYKQASCHDGKERN